MALWYNLSCGEGLNCVHQIQLSSHFQSDGLPNPPARIKVAPFALRPPAHTGRSWPWQDPMRDPEWRSRPASWAEMALSPLPPSISTSNRISTKTTQLGNKNAEGQKEKEKEVEGGEGVETNHIWSKDSQWLFNCEHALGSIWTVTFRACLHKSDAPLKGPLNWQLFLALCGAGQGPKTLISLGRDGKERSYTLKTHRVPLVLAFVLRPLFLLVTRGQWEGSHWIGCSQIE